MEVDVKSVIFLVLFIVLGIVLLTPIVGYVNNLTTPYLNNNVSKPNPQYVGASNATLLNLVPLFYILVLIIVPAVIAYKMYRE